MPAIDGIASGLDTTALIGAMTSVTEAQKGPLQDQLENLEDRRETLADFSGKLTALADKLDELVDRDTLIPLTATASSEAQFTMTTTEANIEGAFDVQVHALAANASSTTQGFADKDALGTIGQGTLTVTYAGVDVAVTIDATNDSLQGLADAIDAVDGVRAYVVDTGEATDPYRLVVSGEDTGATNTLTFDASGLTGGTVPTFTALTTARDSHVTLNGLDVYSSTNTVSGAVPGVTFDLVATGDTPVRVDLSRDPDALKGRLQEFVDAYNEVIDFYATQTVYNPDIGIRGGLVGESTARRLISELGTLVSDEYGAGTLTALSQIGIKTENTGKLSIDDDVFQTAFTDHYDDTVTLLTADDGPFATMTTRVRDVYVDADNGVLASRDETLEGMIADLNDRIDLIDERVAREEERLRARFTAMEVAMSELNATSQYLTALLPQTSLIGSTSS